MPEKTLDWWLWQKHGQENYLEGGKNDTIYWQDIITGSVYGLSRAQAAEIIKVAIGWIDENEEKLTGYFNNPYKFLAHSEKMEEETYLALRLFPELPYIAGVDSSMAKALPRISDVASLTTGLFYAISGDKPMAEKNRRAIYLSCLEGYGYDGISQINEQIKEAVILCRKAAAGEKLLIEKTKAESMKFDLVKGSSVKIKQYLMESPKIKDIRGASVILDRINNELIVNYVRENHVPESFIYYGGGNIVAVVPHGQGAALARKYEELHEEYTLTAQSVAAFLPTSFDELLSDNGFALISRRLEMLKEERQMHKVNTIFNPLQDIEFKVPAFIDEGDRHYIKPVKDGENCKHCGYRKAKVEINETALCPSCAYKVMAGKESKSVFHDEFLNYLEAHCYKTGPEGENQTVSEALKNSCRQKPPSNLEDIAKYSASPNTKSIGVIYGDGNNMGFIIQKLTSMSEFRYFSKKTEYAAYKATFDAVAEVIRDSSFEVIALGGDDIFIIVPGDVALETAVRLGEIFDSEFKRFGGGSGNNPVTMSVGLVIAYHKKPVQYLFNIAQELLKSAKEKSRNNNSGGTIDVAVLESFGSFAASVKEFRKNTLEKKDDMGNTTSRLTLRPYSWAQTKSIMGLIKKLKSDDSKGRPSRGNLYNLRKMLIDNTKEEATLYFLYKHKVFDKEYIKKSMIELAEHGNHKSAMAAGPFIYDGGEAVSPWLDVLELWDYVDGGEKIGKG